MMGDEGAGRGSTGDGVHHRGFHFQESLFRKVVPNAGNQSAACFENFMDLGIRR